MSKSYSTFYRTSVPLAGTKSCHRLVPSLLIVLIVLAAFVIRVTSLEAQSLWRDEVDALCYAFGFPRALGAAVAPGTDSAAATPCACPPTPISPDGQAAPSLLLRLAQTLGAMVQQNGPLYYFLLRGWIALAGSSVTALRFFSLWFGVLGVPLTYALGRRLLGRATGVLAALLVALSPYLTWYSQEVKMYTLVPALALLAVYALRRAVDGGGTRWWAVQTVAASLALYTHIWSAFLIPVLVLLFLAWRPRSRRHWRGGLVSLAVLTLPYLPLAAWEVRHVFVPRDTGFPSYTLGQMALTLLAGWGTGVTGWSWPWGGMACGGAALLGLASILPWGTRAKDWRTVSGLVGWMMVPLLGIWFVSQWQPLFTDRYLSWAAPAFYLLAGAGLAFLWEHGRWPVLPLLATMFLIFAPNLWRQATLPIKSDFRSAAAFVGEHYEPEDLLIFQIPHARYTFDYYFDPAEYAWEDGLYTNHRLPDGSYQMSQGRAAARMVGMTWGRERVWLIASEVDMWDQRHLVHEWLEEHGTRLAEAHFVQVDVFLYTLPSSP